MSLDPELAVVLEEAIIELCQIGRYWIPGYQVEAIEAEVQERLPKRNIIQSEPEPYDEHVLIDATNGHSDAEVVDIAHR